MTLIAIRDRTIIQTWPKVGEPDDAYQALLTLEGISLPLDVNMQVTIDGVRYVVGRERSVDIDTKKHLVTTTITVMKAME